MKRFLNSLAVMIVMIMIGLIPPISSATAAPMNELTSDGHPALFTTLYSVEDNEFIPFNNDEYTPIAYDLINGDNASFEELAPEEQKIVGSIVGEIYYDLINDDETPSPSLPDIDGSPSSWPQSIYDFKFPFSGVYNNYWTGEIWKNICGYGCGKHRYDCSFPHAARHSVDLACDGGGCHAFKSFVLAPARGIVEECGWSNGYGWRIIMNHGNGFKSIVAHLNCDPNAFTQKGHDLVQGTLIGISGSSDTGTPHIHFSIWKDGCSIPLDGISGGARIIPGGRYCSGNAYIHSPKWRTTCP